MRDFGVVPVGLSPPPNRNIATVSTELVPSIRVRVKPSGLAMPRFGLFTHQHGDTKQVVGSPATSAMNTASQQSGSCRMVISDPSSNPM